MKRNAIFTPHGIIGDCSLCKEFYDCSVKEQDPLTHNHPVTDNCPIMWKEFLDPPYSYETFLDRKYAEVNDIDPVIAYDGYVFELEQQGYVVYGNPYDGIVVKKQDTDDLA